MRYYLSASIVVLWLSIGAQSHNFSIGLTYQPCFYKNFNHYDWNNRPKSYPDNLSTLNGYAIGITSGFLMSNIIGMRAELLYSLQAQHHTETIATRTDGSGNKIYYYGDKAISQFSMLKLPVMITGSIEIGYESGIFITGYLGPQISLLTGYSHQYYHYAFDSELNIAITDSVINKVVFTPGQSYQRIWDETLSPPGYKEIHHERPYIYNRLQVGAVAGIELSKALYDRLRIGIGGRFEYDFTESEKYPDLVFGLSHPDRGASHHTRIALTATVSYRLGI